jgi:arylsulfatase A-like enzyme
MIAIDDLRPMLGCYGDPIAKTPNIDRLAERGMLFERAYCQFAKCGPSRLSLLTGLRPDAVGVFSHNEKDMLAFRKRRPDAVAIPRWFKDHGWRAQGFGKVYHDGWDNPDDWSATAFPGRNGEMLETVDKAAIAKVPFEKRNEIPTIISPRHDCPAIQAAEVPDDTLFEGRMTNRVIETLAGLKKAETPWFLAVGYRRPHLPFVAPKKYFDLYEPDPTWLPGNRQPPTGSPILAWFNSDGYAGFGKKADLGSLFPNPPKTRDDAFAWAGFELRSYVGVPYHGGISDDLQLRLRQAYLACISYVDAQIGRLLKSVGDDTIIVLWSDHGWHLGEQGTWGKMTNFEQATRVPLIIAAPGDEFSRGKTMALAELVDLYPTLCELAGIGKPKHLEGESLVPILKDPEAELDGTAFSQFPRFGEKVHGRAIRTHRWRYVWWKEMATGEIVERELYDHETDSAETVNVASRPKNAEIVAELERRLGERK